MESKVLVTGATGFIGRRLVDRLLGSGARVRALVLPFGDLARIAGVRPRLVNLPLFAARAMAAVMEGVQGLLGRAERVAAYIHGGTS